MTKRTEPHTRFGACDRFMKHVNRSVVTIIRQRWPEFVPMLVVLVVVFVLFPEATARL